MSTPTILRRILARKHEEVAMRGRVRPLGELRAALADAPPPRGFADALAQRIGRPDPTIALLTPGPHHNDFFSHAYLARYLGFLLVEGADLRAENGRVFLKTLDGLHPIDLIVRCVAGASSDALPSSVLSFDLPATEVTETTRIAVRLIDPTGTPAPSTAHPARLPRDGSGLPLGAMDDGEGLDLVLVPLRYDTDGSRRLPDTSDAWLGQLRGLLTSLYPLVDVQITVREPVPWTRGLTFTGNVDFGAINAMLRDLRDTDRARPGSYYYAIVAPDDTFSAYCGGSCVTGQSYVVDAPEDDNFRVGSGVDFGTEDSAWTAAHEIGHEFGRYHAPCDTSGADVDYPYAGGAIGVWGYDPRSRTFLPPTTTDFMGYCDPQWISDYTWSAMFARNLAVTPLSSGRSAARAPMLLVRTGGEAGTVMVGVRSVRPPRTATTRFYRYLDARGRVIALGSAPALSSSHTSELLVSLPTPPLGAALLELDGDAISL